MKKPITLLFAGIVLGGLCHAQPTQLGIDRSAGPSRITLQGETNRDYSLQASDQLSSPNWNFLSTHTLINPSQTWFDSASAVLPNRFYRALKLNSPVPPEIADDFRLIDHQGISRSLYYHDYTVATNVKAVVLIFTGNGCSNVAQMVSTINTLRTNFSPKGVLFWMVDANSADNRSNIVTGAAALGITNIPILHDRAQLVTRAYRATTTPEAVCVSTLGWPIFYRGTVDDRIGSSPVTTTQNYLSNALTSFLAGGTVSPRQTQTNGCAITLNTIPTTSYSADIAPLLQAKCIVCHSPGNFASFPMTNYAVISNKAPEMRVEILAGRMPPWHADPFYQTFTNDFSLKTNEAAMLVKWLDDGAPRGSGPDPLTNAPPPPDYPFAWPVSLGAPSNIITLPTQPIDATGVNDYREWDYTYTGSNVWLRAAIILPGTVPVVHHILSYNGAENNEIQSYLTGYAPGSHLGAFPAGTGKLLTNGTIIRFQFHYVAIGTATNDISRLGLYTMPNAPSNALIQTSALSDFCIPPNTTDYQAVANSSTFATNVRLYEFSPHLHTRGVRFKYEAIYPSGHVPASEVLLSVPHYVFHWQSTYRLTQPKDLPAGSKIRVTAGWDNSYQNYELMELYNDPDNPNASLYSPYYINNPACGGIKFGLQTWDEMFIGYFNYSVLP